MHLGEGIECAPDAWPQRLSCRHRPSIVQQARWWGPEQPHHTVIGSDPGRVSESRETMPCANRDERGVPVRLAGQAAIARFSMRLPMQVVLRIERSLGSRRVLVLLDHRVGGVIVGGRGVGLLGHLSRVPAAQRRDALADVGRTSKRTKPRRPTRPCPARSLRRQRDCGWTRSRPSRPLEQGSRRAAAGCACRCRSYFESNEA